MKDKALIFLILTLVTGVVGFAGFSFFGIVGIRILFLVFADLLVISLLAKVLFPEEKEMKPIKVRK